MNSGRLDVKIKRVCSRKRSRDHLKTHLTPVRKRGGSVRSPGCPISLIMSDARAPEVSYCHTVIIYSYPPPLTRPVLCLQFYSDSEDLFGDYDSLLEDSSVLAKLDDAEQNERRRVDGQPPPTEDALTDSILDDLGDDAFRDLPSSQLQFQEDVQEQAKRSRLQHGDKTSTPFRDAQQEADTEDKTKRGGRARRSVADLLKRTMLGNAATPTAVSRAAVLKEAVVSEEISVAMLAMETVSAETTDLGPFFGLPSRVKDLMFKLRGIQSLYGEDLCPGQEWLQSFNGTSNMSLHASVFLRLAGDVSEPGLCPAEEEPDLLSSHQWRENSGCRDPDAQRAAVQEEGLCVHPAVRLTGAGEGSLTRLYEPAD